MIDTIPSMNGRLNGKHKQRSVSRKALRISSVQVSNLGTYITIGLGTGIPLLSLSLSSLGGSLLAGGVWHLGLVALCLCVCVLGVSLSHLAWAIGDITKSPPWANWALGLSIDATLVACELSHVFGQSVDVYWLRLGLMVSVTAASVVLNCWAFCRGHDPKKAK